MPVPPWVQPLPLNHEKNVFGLLNSPEAYKDVFLRFTSSLLQNPPCLCPLRKRLKNFFKGKYRKTKISKNKIPLVPRGAVRIFDRTRTGPETVPELRYSKFLRKIFFVVLGKGL